MHILPNFKGSNFRSTTRSNLIESYRTDIKTIQLSHILLSSYSSWHQTDAIEQENINIRNRGVIAIPKIRKKVIRRSKKETERVEIKR